VRELPGPSALGRWYAIFGPWAARLRPGTVFQAQAWKVAVAPGPGKPPQCGSLDLWLSRKARISASQNAGNDARNRLRAEASGIDENAAGRHGPRHAE
jgi:hypothetical protein